MKLTPKTSKYIQLINIEIYLDFLWLLIHPLFLSYIVPIQLKGKKPLILELCATVERRKLSKRTTSLSCTSKETLMLLTSLKKVEIQSVEGAY